MLVLKLLKKVHGKSKLVETIGCSSNWSEIERLFQLAENRIKDISPNLFDVGLLFCLS